MGFLRETHLSFMAAEFLVLVLDNDNDDEDGDENIADNPHYHSAQLRLVRGQMRFRICLPICATPRLTN